MDGVEGEEVAPGKCTNCYDKNITKRRYKQSPLCNAVELISRNFREISSKALE